MWKVKVLFVLVMIYGGLSLMNAGEAVVESHKSKMDTRIESLLKANR